MGCHCEKQSYEAISLAQGSVSGARMANKDSPEDTRSKEAPPPVRRPRESWAQAFEKIGELGEEDRAWLEFANEADSKLQW